MVLREKRGGQNVQVLFALAYRPLPHIFFKSFYGGRICTFGVTPSVAVDTAVDRVARTSSTRVARASSTRSQICELATVWLARVATHCHWPTKYQFPPASLQPGRALRGRGRGRDASSSRSRGQCARRGRAQPAARGTHCRGRTARGRRCLPRVLHPSVSLSLSCVSVSLSLCPSLVSLYLCLYETYLCTWEAPRCS
jgi:hypothetical protein